MRNVILALGLAAILPTGAAFSAEPPKEAAPAADHYSTANTDIGTLLDDPAAKALLEKMVPGITMHPQVDMMRGMTLATLSQFVPDQVSAAKLAEIDKAFLTLPMKK